MGVSQTEDTLVSPPPRLPSPRRVRLSRRARIGLVAGAIVVAAIVVVLATGALDGGGGTSGGGTVDNAYPTALSTVTRRSLSEQTQVSATLGYASPSTVVVPAGTAPSSLSQVEQSASTAQAQLQTAQAMLSADTATLDQASATLAADRAKLTVDCGGDNAGESAASGSAAGGGSGPCATDSQAVSTDRAERVAGGGEGRERSAGGGVGDDRGCERADEREPAESSATVYGQSSTYTSCRRSARSSARQTLYAIGGQPAVLLYGSVGPVAGVQAGMSPGADVRGAEREPRRARLRARPDRRRVHGGDRGRDRAAPGRARVTATGQLLLGSVVFEPGAGPGDDRDADAVGATVQAGPVLAVTATARQVTIAARRVAAGRASRSATRSRSRCRTTDDARDGITTSARSRRASADQGNGSSSPTIEVDVTSRPTRPRPAGSTRRRSTSRSRPAASATRSSCRSTRCSRSRAAATRSRRSAPDGVHQLVGGQHRAVRRRRRTGPGHRRGLAAGSASWCRAYEPPSVRRRLDRRSCPRRAGDGRRRRCSSSTR